MYELSNKLFEQYFINQDNSKWKEYTLTDLVEVNNGYSYTGSELVDKSEIGMATIKNFNRTGGFKIDGYKSIDPIKAKENQYLNMFDILIACTDLTQAADIIGNAVMVLNRCNYKKNIMSMDLVKLTPFDENKRFVIYSIVNSKQFKVHALGYKSGTTVLHLNKQCFNTYNIKLPEEDILLEFNELIMNNYKMISSIIEENIKLEQLRDTLLPKLMNGEIDLDKVEI